MHEAHEEKSLCVPPGPREARPEDKLCAIFVIFVSP
jgi:hypothetical protein